MNKKLLKNILKPSVVLGLFTLVGVLLLNVVNQQTLVRIEDNERAALIQQLVEVVDKNSHDNDLLTDTVTLTDDSFNSSTPVTVYRAKKQGKPSAAIFVTTSSRGYKGTIQIIVGVRMDKTISGVRVVRHNETPGLGDKMEIKKSPWVLSFNNKSLQHPVQSQWEVKKDGGYFDQFTGATITPRAIVRSVRDVLIWSNQGDQLLSLFTRSTKSTMQNNTH